MKRYLKIIIGVLVGLFLILLFLPLVFKGKIEKIVKHEVNNQVNAKVEYADFSLSLIRSFPDINLGIKGLSVVGYDSFAQDTLVYLGEFSTEINMISALRGQVEVQSLLLKDLSVNAVVLADSSANWDIAIASPDEAVVDQDSAEASDFRIVLESFVIDNANIRYTDQVMNLKSEVHGFNMHLSGDMSEAQSNLQMASSINKVLLNHDGITYVNGATLAFEAGIRADFENQVYSFLENELMINRLALTMDGDVKVKEEGYGLDLRLGTTNTDFKSLLALVPQAYMSDLEGLQTAGTMNLDVQVKGDYMDEEHLPAFDLSLGVENGMIQYPDLPESINDINIKLNVSNGGGNADQTITNLEQFHFVLANNPFDANLNLRTPVSNPVFKGEVNGRIDLGSLLNAIPLDSIDIKGVIEAEFAIDGDYATLEREEYESINAQGNLTLTNVAYKNKDVPQGVLIKTSKMTFNPKAVRLENFDCQIGQSDFQLNGVLENYLAYALKDGTLKGQLKHYSKLINSNEFLTMSQSESTDEDSEPDESALVEVPKNIDFVLHSKVDRFVYDKLKVYRANGKLTIRNGIVKMDGLKMHLLDGQMTVSGQYNTANVKKPFVDFNITGKDLDLNMAANSFSVVDSLLPLAKKTVGRVSPKFEYYSRLNEQASPVLSSINGGGWLRSKSVEVSGSKIQNTLASTLNNESYRKMKAEDLNINFIIDKGNVVVKPFKTKVGGQMVEVQGTQGVDQSINYQITMPVSRKEVTKMAGLMGFNLPTSGDDLIVDVLVTGTVKEPQLGFNLDKAQKQVTKELKKEGENFLKNILKGF